MLRVQTLSCSEERCHACCPPSAADRRRARRSGAVLRDHARCRDAAALSDGVVSCRRLHCSPDRPRGAPQRGHRRAGGAPLSGGRRRGRAAPASSRPPRGGACRLGGRVAPRDRVGSAHGGRGQRQLDHPVAGRLPGHRDGPAHEPRDSAGAPAPSGLCLQAAHLDVATQGPGAAGGGKKRLAVEAVLAAAALPASPPMAALLPDPTDTDLLPWHEPWFQALLDRIAGADLYLQDEVYIALHPTLTRVWCRRGRRGQRRVQAPGKNAKKGGFGLVDWRAGWFDWAIADHRAAEPFCTPLRRAVERSKARGRVAIVLLDNLGIHTPRRSKKLRALLEEYKDDLLLVYTPTYDPEANRIEWLWRALRAAVTHNHQRQTLAELLDDARVWADALTPAEVLAHIGSPFADEITPPEELKHAASFSGKHLAGRLVFT